MEQAKIRGEVRAASMAFVFRHIEDQTEALRVKQANAVRKERQRREKRELRELRNG